MANREIVIENFNELGYDVDEDVAEKCVELCNRYSIDESSLVDTWVAFSLSRADDIKLSTDSIALMEKNKLIRSSVTPISSERDTRANFRFGGINVSEETTDFAPSISMDYEDLETIESDRIGLQTQITSVYNDTHSNGGAPTRILVHSPRSLFSPASFSPTATLPSRKYSDRTDAGHVVCAFGPNKDSTEWKTTKFAPEPLNLAEDFFHIPNNTRFMFENIGNLILVSKKLADTICLDIIKNRDIKFPVDVHQVSMETTTYAGRIKCDSNGKLNSSSILLESCLFNKRGDSVQLQVSDLKDYSLFPGQIVVIEGKNPTGVKIIAEKLYMDVELPLCPTTPKYFLEPREPMQIVVSAGPYTPRDTLSYQPWQDLCDYVRNRKPHVLILIGPIVDCLHPHVVDNLISEPFLLFFERQLSHLLDSLQKPTKIHTKVVLVSNWLEAGQMNVFPTPCTRTKLNFPNLLLAPDPCVLNINGFHMALTSTDILMHLKREELLCSTTGPVQGLGRLAAHLLLQKNFYPLLPPAEEMSIDYNLLFEHGLLPYVPHMLIIPSNLNHFVTNIKGCIIVNPGKLSKGQVGGSFARVEVAAVNDGGCWSPGTHVTVQVVKI